MVVVSVVPSGAQDWRDSKFTAHETSWQSSHSARRRGSIFFTADLLLNSILRQPTLVPFNRRPGHERAGRRRVDYMCADVVTGGPQLDQNLCGASAARSAAMPNVPTSVEGGLPAFQASA